MPNLNLGKKVSQDDQDDVIASSERRDAVASLRESRLPQQNTKSFRPKMPKKEDESVKLSETNSPIIKSKKSARV